MSAVIQASYYIYIKFDTKYNGSFVSLEIPN